MIGAVIFDMDGLLVDSERLYLHFLPEALKRFGLPFREEVADRTRGVTNEEGGPIVEEIYSDYPGTDGYAVLSTLQKTSMTIALSMGYLRKTARLSFSISWVEDRCLVRSPLPPAWTSYAVIWITCI